MEEELSYKKAGVDIDALGAQLQSQAIDAKVKSWIDLMSVIASKSADLTHDQYDDHLHDPGWSQETVRSRSATCTTSHATTT